MSLNTFKQRLRKSQSIKNSVRFLPYAPTPHEYRKKLPNPTFNCESCAQNSQDWSICFYSIYDRYEEVYNQLQSVSTQLLAAKSKLRNENASPTRTMNGKLDKSTQTDDASKSHAHTQTLDAKKDVSTQIEVEVPKSHVQTQAMNTKGLGIDAYCEQQDNQQLMSASDVNLYYRYATMHDHSYAEGIAITDYPELNLYKCRVCAKVGSYDQIRKHYLQFINRPSTRVNRYEHSQVSPHTHQQYLNELKSSKKNC